MMLVLVGCGGIVDADDDAVTDVDAVVTDADDVDADAGVDSNVDTDVDTDADTDADTGVDTGVDSEAEAEDDSEAEAEDSEAETEVDSEAETEDDTAEADDVPDVHVPVCGDGIVEGSEECDGPATRVCSTSCGSTGGQSCGWGCTWESCLPPVEACNAVDDDCDTVPDDGFACTFGAAVACTTACGSAGTGTCATCTIPTGADCAPPAEVCDGTDNDCDTIVDEDMPLCGCYTSDDFEDTAMLFEPCYNNGWVCPAVMCAGHLAIDATRFHSGASSLRVDPNPWAFVGGTTTTCGAGTRHLATPGRSFRISVWIWVPDPSTWEPCYPGSQQCNVAPVIIPFGYLTASLRVWSSFLGEVPGMRWTPERWMLIEIEYACTTVPAMQIQTYKLDGVEYGRSETVATCTSYTEWPLSFTTNGTEMYVDDLCVMDLP